MLALNEYDPLTRNQILEEYIEEIVNGDKEALVKLYELTKNSIYGFVLSIIKNKHDAEDIFQEVYIKIYENIDKYKNEGKPLAWMMTIAKNLCYEKIRKHRDTSDIELMHDVGINDKNKKNVEDKMILEILLEKITDEERNIIILHIVSGMKYREIANLLKLPLSTVLSKYHRAMKRMKCIMKEDMV